MPGRNEREAWTAFKQPMEKVVGCIDQTIRLNERRFETGIWLLATPSGGIKFGPALTLTFSLHLEPLDESGEWRMTTRKYDFELCLKTDPSKIVFGWHWHPASKRSHITYPHLHVPSALDFKTRHIPTGRVSLEDVILFGFDELNVTPAFDTAPEIVAEVRDRHKKYRSWN
jgi:hypothetical protein